MKHFSRSHAAVAVTFDGAYVMLPESFDKKKKTEHKAFRIAFDLSSNQIHVTVCCVFQVQVEKTNIRER